MIRSETGNIKRDVRRECNKIQNVRKGTGQKSVD